MLQSFTEVGFPRSPVFWFMVDDNIVQKGSEN